MCGARRIALADVEPDDGRDARPEVRRGDLRRILLASSQTKRVSGWNLDERPCGVLG